MFGLFKRARATAIDFCDRCGSVCGPSCRREAVIGRARDRALAGRVL